MFAEFAVEPAAMARSIDRFTGMIDRFGIDQGRIISDFADGGWANAVMAAAEANLPPAAQQSVEARLADAKREKTILRMRTYPKVPGGWAANVIAEDTREPWHGVVSEEGCCRLACETKVADVRNSHPPFNVPRSGDFPRTAEGIVSAATQLIRISKVLHLVDPHIALDARPDRIRQWVEPIAGLINISPTLDSVIIHTLDRDDKPPRDLFQDNFRRRFQNRLSERPKVQIQRWRERAGGEQLHDRFVLTDVGGLEYGQGLDAGPVGTRVRVQLLDRAGWELQLQKLDPKTSPYEAEAPIEYQAGRRVP
jgi:hypothetical protein